MTKLANRGSLVLAGWIALLPACSTSQQSVEQPTPGQPTLTIATYNLNYGLAGDPATVEAVPEADIVLLQETTDAWERALAQHTHPHRAFRHCCVAGGVGILSRYPFREVAYIDPPDGGWFPGWVLMADTPLGTIQVLNVHLRPPRGEGGSVVSGYFTTPPVRRSQIEHYAGYLDPVVPTIVGGDFNEEPGGLALEFLEGRGFQSALRVADDDSSTWRWNTSVGQVKAQLDHVLVDRHFRVVSASVVDAGRSDHLPVVTQIEKRIR